MPPLTWTGFYFGAHVGTGWDDACEYDPKYTKRESRMGMNDVDYCDEDDNFWIGGVHAGYNWQKDGPFVFGIEGDVSFGDDIDYLASIRGRLGFALDNLLIYGTAGAAFIGVEDSFGETFHDNGWVFGVGADYKIAQNMSVGLEGLYYAFDENDNLYYSDDNDFWVVRARLSYHLNEAYPEALK
jgi:outer membrane immunogenic protein